MLGPLTSYVCASNRKLSLYASALEIARNIRREHVFVSVFVKVTLEVSMPMPQDDQVTAMSAFHLGKASEACP